MTIQKALALIATIIFMTASLSASAEEDERPDWNETTLTGNWDGTRDTLFDRGLDIGITHKSDILSNVSGGIKRGTEWIGHTELKLTMDLEKSLGWQNTTAYIHFHSALGSKFNRDYIGGFSGVDNIEVNKNTAQFYQAWIQKGFFNNSLLALVGLYPIDSEFYVTDTSGVFISPPYGMANDLAQTGRNGPPVYPLGALAVRLKFTSPNNNWYLQYALTDGVPGDPNNQHGTHIKLGNKDGTLSIVELGYTPQADEAGSDDTNIEQETAVEEAEVFSKTAIGFWHYTSRFDDLIDLDAFGKAKRRHNQGAYVMTERTLYTEKDHPSQGLSGFVRFGVASEDINLSDWTASAGLRYHGLILGRDNDIAGIAITVNHAGDKWRRLNNAESQETDVEATYRVQVKNWLAVQPMVQGIFNPGMDRSLKNAWVVGVRSELTF